MSAQTNCAHMLVALAIALSAGCDKHASTRQAPAPGATSSGFSSAPTEAHDRQPPDELVTRCHAGLGELVRGLQEPMKFEVFTHPATGRFATHATVLEMIAERVAQRAPENLIYEAKDSASPSGRERAETVNANAEVQHEGTKGNVTVALSYRSAKETITLWSLDRPWLIEALLASAMRRLRDKGDVARPRVGVVVGKRQLSFDEKNLNPDQVTSMGTEKSGTTLRKASEVQVPMSQVDVELESKVDETLAALIVTQPGEDYTDVELERIDAFVLRGGTLLVFAGAANIPAFAGHMTATLDTRRLDVLLRTYGVEVRKDVLLDPPATLKMAALRPDGTPYTVEFHGLVHYRLPDRLNGRFPPFAGSRHGSLTFPFASSLQLHLDAQPGARTTVIAHASDIAQWRTKSPVALGLGAGPAGDESGSRPIGVVIEGALKSAFGNGHTTAARIIILSSPQFLVNPITRASTTGKGGPKDPTDELYRKGWRPYMDRLNEQGEVYRDLMSWAIARGDLAACWELSMSSPPLPTPSRKDSCSKSEMTQLLAQGLRTEQVIEVCSPPAQQ